MANPVAEVAARKLLRNYANLPVSLEHLCKLQGIELRFMTLGKINAIAFRQRDTKVILVNDTLCRNRQRFSIAHEIGHIFMEHGYISFSIELNNQRPKWQEPQANSFASELLMPRRLLVRYGFLTTQQIAEMCEVSLEAATYRAERLGWMQTELGI